MSLRWLPLLLLATGCALDRSALEEPLVLESPLVAGGRLLWLDAPRTRLLTLDAAAGALTCSSTLDRPRGLQARDDDVWLLGETEGRPALHRRDLATGARSTLQLSHRFDTVVLGPGREQATLLATPAGVTSHGGLPILDPSRVAVVDSDTVTHVPIEAGGLATGAIYAPDGATVAVLLQRGVLLIDAATPSRHRLAHLDLADGTSLHPKEARFTPDGTHLLLLAEGTGDLLVIRIFASGDDFGAAINLLSAPVGPVERMLVLDDEHVAVVAGKTVSVLHLGGDTTKTRSRVLAARPLQLATQEDGILLFAGVNTERDGVGVAAWDPMEDLLDQAMLDGALVDARSVGGRIFVLHRGAEGYGLSSMVAEATGVDLRLRLRTYPLSGWPTALAQGRDDGSVLLGVHGGGADIYDGPVAAGTLVALEPGRDSIASVVLDDAIVEVGVVGESLFALHPSRLGDLTLVPAGDVRRSHTKRWEGIFAAELGACE